MWHIIKLMNKLGYVIELLRKDNIQDKIRLLYYKQRQNNKVTT